MLVTHVWYVSNPIINFGVHEPYGFFSKLFKRNLVLYIDFSFFFFKFCLIPIKIEEKEGKYNQKKNQSIMNE